MLGAVLVDNQAFNSAAELVTRDDFHRESHRRIFDAMAALAERSQPIDLVTLKDELARGAALEAVGGSAYLASLRFIEYLHPLASGFDGSLRRSDRRRKKFPPPGPALG